MKKNAITIDEKDLGTIYQELGKGVEGTVYKYDDSNVIKIYNKNEGIDFASTMERVKYLLNIKIDDFAFPKKLVYNDKDEIIGYSMKLIKYNEYKSFFNLIECKDNDEFIDYFIKAQKSLKKLHEKKIYVGDFNPNNIMIDEDSNPIFIDTINYSTPKFSFLIEPYSSKIHEKLFKNKCSLLNNDKFMFNFLFISYFISKEDLEKAIKNPNYFYKIIDNFNISNTSKEILKRNFSQNDDKEYIDSVLEDFKNHEHQKYDNKFGMIIKMVF